jgi:MinD superfamily P-loop ATPase
MRLAVASGKGGTGKTLVATNLAWCLAEAGRDVMYVDADVEAPNGHLFLHPEGVKEARFTVGVPALREGTCSGCGDCQEACAFNAILALKDRVMVFPELCHSCGACLLSCGEEALVEQHREVGTLRRGTSGGIGFWSAVLDIGEAKAPPLIQGLLQDVAVESLANDRVVILDAPPGTSCSAMSVVRGADQVVLVTEPTPFGLHDLELAVQMCRALEKPVTAIINRSDLGDGEVLAWLEEESVPLLAEIPFSPELAAAYAEGELAARRLPFLRRALDGVARAVAEEGGTRR